MAKIFLIRHGEAEQNVVHILSSLGNDEGYGLTDRGRNQIRLVADSLRSDQVDVLYASPLRRTVETAEIVGTAIGLSAILDGRLRETDFGRYAGGRAETFWQRYTSEVDRIETDGTDGVESFTAVRGRVQAFWQEISAKHEGANIAIVSHGDTLQILCGLLEGRSLVDTFSGWNPKLGEMKVLELDIFPCSQEG